MENECQIFEGIVIGAAGGAAAGIIILFIQYIKMKCVECFHKERIYKWLQKNTADEDGKRFRTTRSIASWNIPRMMARYKPDYVGIILPNDKYHLESLSEILPAIKTLGAGAWLIGSEGIKVMAEPAIQIKS